jgi:type II secretory pathway component PulC
MSFRILNNSAAAVSVVNSAISFSQSVPAGGFITVTDAQAYSLFDVVNNITNMEIEKVNTSNLVVSNPSSTGVTTAVTSVTTVATLLAANSARVRAVINNASSQLLYVLLGAGTVSSTNYTFVVPATASSIPGQLLVPSEWQGVITGTWVSANGYAYVTEMTP